MGKYVFDINLNKEEYEKFVYNNKTKSHFLQSYNWGEFKKKVDHNTPYYVGLKLNNKLVATALLLEKKMPLGFTYLYSPRGYVLDYDNKALIKEFTTNIKLFAKSKRSIFVKIDPDIRLQEIDDEALKIKDINSKLVEYLKSLGYKHLGYTKDFDSSQPRYTFRLNLDRSIEDITSNFHPTTKNIVGRGNPFNIEILKNTNIDDFLLTMHETAKREDIINHTDYYYREFYKELHQNKMCDLYVLKVNINNLKDIYDKRINEIEKKLGSFTGDDKKTKNQIVEYTNQLTKALKERDNINNIKEKELVLSSMLVVKYSDKAWTVHGGNHSLLRELNANYLMYYEIIKDMNKEGYKIIDFFGTTGNPDKNNKVYGIHLFKKRLGGEYLEFIGEFDLVINKFMYFVFVKVVPIYRKIKRVLIKK